MQRNMLLLFAVAIAGIFGLVIFAQMSAASNPKGNSVGIQPTINLGGDENTVNLGGAQIVEIKALGTGVYDKLQVRVKAGVPVKFRFTAEQSSGCGRQIVIPDFGVNLVSRNGETVEATFTPQKGQYAYRCGMNMFRGVLYAD